MIDNCISPQRLRLQVRGMVQGVGFRPFVYNLATGLGLRGWARNNDRGVEIEIEGDGASLAEFLARLEVDRPVNSLISQLETTWLPPCGDDRFEIQPSNTEKSTKSAWILPDLATCPDCLQEIFDPHNRRYRYPFTNCTHCGPRYSILKGLPYDRPNTTMAAFTMCPSCQQEYDNPDDRRFHAQPNACPVCGPRLKLVDNRGATFNTTDPIVLAAAAVRQGKILALKGLGGFHLIANARHPEAIRTLRERKHRPSKPFALMYPHLEAIGEDCFVSPVERDLLLSPAAPIVLLRRKKRENSPLAPAIAPQQSTLGVMLPHTPLHHLLLAELGTPIVATSGNLSQEPICIDNEEALENLGKIADLFLLHDRPIARPVDDSVARTIADRPTILRRARGYAPFPIPIDRAETIPCILAVGGHLKNTVALFIQGQIVVSQHLGDLDRAQTLDRFRETIDRLLALYDVIPASIACDLHPDYASSQFARTLSQQQNIPLVPLQHHYAHVLSGMVDNNLKPPVLGVAWDGTGYGTDGTIWGGEFLTVTARSTCNRIAHLRTFPLVGGDRAIREPRRAALGLLYAALGEAAFELECPTLEAFSPQELKILRTMLQKGINSPITSSMGRLFDGVSSLIGLCQQSTFEGDAAMRLEGISEDIETDAAYPYTLNQDVGGTWIVDWQPMLMGILEEIGRSSLELKYIPNNSIAEIAAKFHNTLTEIVSAIADRAEIAQIVLTGGCFQNRYLLEKTIQRLRGAGFDPYWHDRVPPNDGGIAAGQILGAYWQSL
jgi:hydrogenase maturation protein HypF